MNLQLTIPDMACSACVSTITQAIHALDPSAQVQADTTTKLVIIETLLSGDEVQQAIQQAGYTPQTAARP
jgi:copper chaperone